jgi:hypothetical protein
MAKKAENIVHAVVKFAGWAKKIHQQPSLYPGKRTTPFEVVTSKDGARSPTCGNIGFVVCMGKNQNNREEFSTSTYGRNNIKHGAQSSKSAT